MKSVAVFGAFDHLHSGHLAFLQQARELGDSLTVYLAQDEIIQTLKGMKPEQSFRKRKKALEDLPMVDYVLKGDHTLGNYRGVSITRPDIIAIGYDQNNLEQDLRGWLEQYGIDIPIVKLKAFEPETYKTSLLRKYYD